MMDRTSYPNDFANQFWDESVPGFKGPDALFQLMKNGRNFYKQYEEYIEKRAKIEDEYWKSLNKLAKSFDTVPTFTSASKSTLELAWNSLKMNTGIAANCHMDLAIQLQSQHQQMAKNREELRRKQKQIEEELRREQQSKQKAYKKLQDDKKTYHQACQKYDKSEAALDQATHNAQWKAQQFPPLQLPQGGSKQEKEVTKALDREKSAKQERNSMHETYKESIDALGNSLELWKQTLSTNIQKIELLEIERMKNLRNSMWFIVNLMSKALVEHDDTNEAVRLELENVDPYSDNKAFAKNNYTGRTPPVCPAFEEYQKL